MPTYEYKCDACGHGFEKFQSMSAPHLRTCPHCGKKKLRRLIGTGAGLIFKGSGFYITDYRSESYQNAAKADSATSTSSGNGNGAASGSPQTPAPSKAKEPAATAATSSKSDAKPATPKKAKVGS